MAVAKQKTTTKKTAPVSKVRTKREVPHVNRRDSQAKPPHQVPNPAPIRGQEIDLRVIKREAKVEKTYSFKDMVMTSIVVGETVLIIALVAWT
jgi:hypothetical protein